jgi:hypothetical protein
LPTLSCRYCDYPTVTGRSFCPECGKDYSRTQGLVHRAPELVGDRWWYEKRRVLKCLCIAESTALAVWALGFVLLISSWAGIQPAEPILGAVLVVPPCFWTIALAKVAWHRPRALKILPKSRHVMQPMILSTLWITSFLWLLGPLAIFIGNAPTVIRWAAVLAIMLSVSVAICLFKQVRYSGIFVGRQSSRSRRACVKLLVLVLGFGVVVSGKLSTGDMCLVSMGMLLPIIVPTMLRQLLPFVPARRGHTQRGSEKSTPVADKDLAVDG